MLLQMPALAGIGGRLALGYLGSCQPCLPIPAVAGIVVFYKFHRGTRVPRHSRLANHVCDFPNKICKVNLYAEKGTPSLWDKCFDGIR